MPRTRGDEEKENVTFREIKLFIQLMRTHKHTETKKMSKFSKKKTSLLTQSQAERYSVL